MTCKWHVWNEIGQTNEEICQSKVDSQWNPSKGHPAVEAFLNKTESKIFSWIPENEKDWK